MLEEYLSPISLDSEYKPYELGTVIERYSSTFPSLTDKKIAILSVSASENSCNSIRKELYGLIAHPTIQNQIVDIGNIIEGETPADTHVAIREVVKTLQELQIVTILLGTNLNQGEALYHAYEGTKNGIETALISSHMPIMEYELLHRICGHQPNYLLNINVLAFQSHFIPPKSLEMLENLNFGHLRLGNVKKNIEEAELYLRNASLTLFDLNAIKHSDAPGKSLVQPNGLTGEEACQLTKYAGMSDSSTCFGVFNYDSTKDQNGLTAMLYAQLIWYYIEGFTSRASDSPDLHDEFVKYRCDLNDNQPPILFLKSKRTSRWWMTIEHPKHPDDKELTLTFPCSYDDYQRAAACETPDRYLNAIKRLQ